MLILVIHFLIPFNIFCVFYKEHMYYIYDQKNRYFTKRVRGTEGLQAGQVPGSAVQ